MRLEGHVGRHRNATSAFQLKAKQRQAQAAETRAAITAATAEAIYQIINRVIILHPERATH